MQRSTARPPAHLAAGGTSVVIDPAMPGGPGIVYWGAWLGEATAATLAAMVAAATPQAVSGGLEQPARLTLVPTEAAGWLDTPGFDAEGPITPEFSMTGLEVAPAAATIHLADAEAGLSLTLDLAVTPSGLFTQQLTVVNDGRATWRLAKAALTFPIPPTAGELLGTSGHHLREHAPQRQVFTIGQHVRESRRGRTGADATLVQVAGTPGFGWTHGQVYGVHLGWSGNHRYTAGKVITGEVFLQVEELLAPGEIVLAPGESYQTPIAYGSHGEGLNQLAGRFHAQIRATHPPARRPVTLNTWEAVYFDHDLDRLVELARLAARVGVERFVLDDGWFAGRADDRSALGDWWPDPRKWPEGLAPLAEAVRHLGLEFGLWVEPEMVNPDSELARTQPEWILRGRTGWPPSARHQQVLDLANPEVYAYLASRLDALVTQTGAGYLKWDHNRDLVSARHDGRPAVHAQTTALYRLLAELRQRHPGLEIETCASGGARFDLGILALTDRVWTSDCLDPLERLPIQRHTALVAPPEYLGAHLTSPVVHSTGRHAELDFAAGVALFHHFGIEQDLTACDEATLERIARWVSLHKRFRRLFATGSFVQGDVADPAIDVRGVVAPDQTEAVFSIGQLTSSAYHPAPVVTLPGLNPQLTYHVASLMPGDTAAGPAQSPLVYLDGGLEFSGAALGWAGLRPPVQYPEHLTLIHVTAKEQQ